MLPDLARFMSSLKQRMRVHVMEKPLYRETLTKRFMVRLRLRRLKKWFSMVEFTLKLYYDTLNGNHFSAGTQHHLTRSLVQHLWPRRYAKATTQNTPNFTLHHWDLFKGILIPQNVSWRRFKIQWRRIKIVWLWKEDYFVSRMSNNSLNLIR